MLRLFIIAFFSFFLSKEFMLFNAEFVFIASFLIFFFLAIYNVGDLIAENLDAREKQIKEEFFALLIQRIKVLAKSYDIVYNLCFISKNIKDLVSLVQQFANFSISFTAASLKAQRRYASLVFLIFTFKNIILLAQKLTEQKIKKLGYKFSFLLLNKRGKKKEN